MGDLGSALKQYIVRGISLLVFCCFTLTYLTPSIPKVQAAPGVLDHFAFDNGFAAGSPKVAGVGFAITIYALDTNGNIVTTFNSPATLLDRTSSISPATTSAFRNGVWDGIVSVTTAISIDDITVIYGSTNQTSATFSVQPDTRFQNLAIYAGNNQAGVVGSTLSSALTVKAVDQYGNAVPNIGLTLSIAAYPANSHGQALSVSSGTTDSLGRLSSLLTLGNKIGTYIVSAKSNSGPSAQVTFYANAASGPATSIELTPLISVLPKNSAQQFFVDGYDTYHNPTTIATPTWSIVNGGGSIDQNGVFTAGSDSGNFVNTVKVQIGSIGALATVTVINETSGRGEGNLPGDGSYGDGGSGSNPVSSASPSPGSSASPDPSASPTLLPPPSPGSSPAGNGNITGAIGRGSGAGGYGDGTGTGAGGVESSGTGNSPLQAEGTGVLDRVYLVPRSVSATTGSKQVLTAQAYDKYNNQVTSANYKWEISGGVGDLSYTTSASTDFTASTTPGNGTVKVTVTQDAITKTADASVSVRPQSGGTITFDTIDSPQKVGTPFTITVSARDFSGNLLGSFNGSVSLTDSTGSVLPSTLGPFASGIWKGEAKISFASDSVTLSAIGSGMSGVSNTFKVEGDGKSLTSALKTVGEALSRAAAAITGSNSGGTGDTKDGGGGSSSASAKNIASANQLLRSLAAGASAGLGLLGAAIGIDVLSSHGLTAIGRNPMAKGKVQMNMYLLAIACLIVAGLSVVGAIAIIG